MQLQTIFSQLRAKVEALPPELRASATFVRYAEMVAAIVALIGPGPNFLEWRKNVSTFMHRWKRKPAALDDHILQILAGARAVERGASERRSG